MTNKLSLATSPENIKALQSLLQWWKQREENGLDSLLQDLTLDTRPPVRFITLQSYSTYVLKSYGPASYDLDGDERSGQKYAVLVDGDTPIDIALLDYDPDGNHKQLIEFQGDNINGTIKLILEGESTEDISLASNTLTREYLTEKLEALPNVGTGNVSVTLWPGRWLVEFVGNLAGQSFMAFEIDRAEDAVFEVIAYTIDWRDSGQTDKLHFPYPLIGEWDGDDNVVNDAVAPGSFGWADFAPGIGYMADTVECREWNGDGSPNL